MDQRIGPESIHDLSPALSGRRREIFSPRAGMLSWYEDGPASNSNPSTPLLLVHSVNAAPSAYEVKPLYEHYRSQRPVFALELPGFGFSQRSDRFYSPRLMTDAVHEILAMIRNQHGVRAIDAVGLSLSSEFLARAACESPHAFRSLCFISPTGFDRSSLRTGRAGSTLGKPWMLSAITRLGLRRKLFDWLTSERMIRRFLRRSWGSRNIDLGLLRYDYATARQPGAEYAPLHFLAGFLFSADSGLLYQRLDLPVYVVHGDRGSFTDFRALRQLEDRRNWTVEVMSGGALPHFERPHEFIHDYDDWLYPLDTPVMRPVTTRPAQGLGVPLRTGARSLS
jgi:pimeloyl-ACP methyl ester carboxylesterase